LAEHLGLDLILIGDSAQADPEIYATIALESPTRIRAVYIRRTEPAEPGRLAEVDALAPRVAEVGVPMLPVSDSVEIAVHAATLGLLPRSAVDQVRAGS
jgi:phosphatidate phosphatase APP1